MTSESFFRQIMGFIMSDDDQEKRRGASAMGNLGHGLDIAQANAFAEALARRAAAEPDSDVQLDLLDGLHDLTMAFDVDPAVLQPIFDIPREQFTEQNAGYVDDLQEYRDLPR